MSYFNLTFDTAINKPNTDIGISVIVYKQEPNEFQVPYYPVLTGKKGVDEQFSMQIEDTDPAEYTIKILMKGKTDDDTVGEGEELSSAEVQLSNFKFDNFNITEVIEKTGSYKHDFNGHSIEVTERFSTTMGCNGVQVFTFTTPVYKWILENS